MHSASPALCQPRSAWLSWPYVMVSLRCHDVPTRQVLHCVMFPRLEYDLPILGMDMVGAKGRVSLAVIDPSPATMDRTLPAMYSQGIR